MNAETYLKKAGAMKQMKSLKWELLGCHIGTGMAMGISILSVFTGEPAAVLAASCVTLLPVGAGVMVRSQIEHLEEWIFQLRIK